MRKIAVSLMLSCGLSLCAQQTITCSSNGNRRQLCPADTRNGVVLVRELSDRVCQQGSTWSYSRQGISVSGGCSGDFQVSGSGPNQGNSCGSGAYDNRNGNPNVQGTGGSGQYGGGGNGAAGYGDRGFRRGAIIPAGTQLNVRLEQTVRPTEANAGEIVSMSLVEDLSINGRVIAPAGTPIQAKVNSARGSQLDLRLTSMNVHGQTYALTSNSIHSVRDSQSGADANQTGKGQLGSLLGTLATGNQLPSGSVYTFRLTSQAQASATNQ